MFISDNSTRSCYVEYSTGKYNIVIVSKNVTMARLVVSFVQLCCMKKQIVAPNFCLPNAFILSWGCWCPLKISTKEVFASKSWSMHLSLLNLIRFDCRPFVQSALVILGSSPAFQGRNYTQLGVIHKFVKCALDPVM